MNRRRIEAMLWIVAVAVLALGGLRLRADAASPAPKGSVSAPPSAPRAVPRARLAAAARAVAGSNPFRLDRVPAPIGFNQPAADLPPGGMPPYMPAAPPRPALAVTGIVGPPWRALLEGIPGREGAVAVRAGDVIGDLRVRDVTRTVVVVSAPDTTWRLTVRKAWQ